MQKFKPSGKVPFGSFILMLIAALIGGVVIGVLVAFVHQFIYLVLVFPLLMAVVGGGLIGLIVRSGKVRSPVMAALFGILIGAVLYGVYRYGAYYVDRQKIVDQLVNEQHFTAAQAQAGFDTVLQKDFGTTGFIGYEQLVARDGISFTSTTSVNDSSAVPIKGPLVYGYWAIEFLIIVGVAAAVASQRANQPFCENCGTWYSGKGMIGSVDNKASKQFIKLLRNGQFAEAKAMFTPPANPPRTDLEMDFCKTCQDSDVVVTAQKVVKTSRNRTNKSVLLRGVVNRQQLPDLMPTKTS